MNKIKEYNVTIFENIKHIDANGTEFWHARELMQALEYTRWENFLKVIGKAKLACELSRNMIYDHFADVSKMVTIGSNAQRKQDDYKLSRYACYLIVQNADSRKKVVALGQTYFAVQTRKQEITEEYFNTLDENKKRLVTRGQTIDKNKILYKAAKESGVKNYGKFTNYGYEGLYGGENAKQIAKRKGLSDADEILDYMGSEELADNLFRIVQTEAKLKNDKIDNEKDANSTHYEVGIVVRETIKKLGGTMPENLPTPEKSILQIQLEEIEKLNNK
ncbi:MAG: DNA damage-inducible protein D [Bacilli bacterium]|nr:DNA damage-inducible protein D [Bacilli bacterium]